MTNALLALRDWLLAEQVSVVSMEATGDYWKPVYYLLEGAGFELMLVNARDAKGLPGRKSDVSDSIWLCQLTECGLLRASLERLVAFWPAQAGALIYQAPHDELLAIESGTLNQDAARMIAEAREVFARRDEGSEPAIGCLASWT